MTDNKIEILTTAKSFMCRGHILNHTFKCVFPFDKDLCMLTLDDSCVIDGDFISVCNDKCPFSYDGKCLVKDFISEHYKEQLKECDK